MEGDGIKTKWFLQHYFDNLYTGHLFFVYNKDTRDRNDFYDPTYKFDYPSHVPSERAVNSKGVRYALFSFLKHSC